MASYSPVFSSQFIVYGGGAGSLEFAVPAGFTAVIRDFTVRAIYAATLAQVQIQNSEAAPAIVVAQLSAAGIEDYEQWTGRVVVPGGGTISALIGTLAADPDIYVGGYLLRNVLS